MTLTQMFERVCVGFSLAELLNFDGLSKPLISSSMEAEIEQGATTLVDLNPLSSDRLLQFYYYRITVIMLSKYHF